jgi:tetratricopeptide (TPR) repeat protein
MGVFVEVHAGEGGKLSCAFAKVGKRIYNLIVSRTLLAAFLLSLPLWAQQPAPSTPQPRPSTPDAQPQEQEPPEEDQSFKPREYDFNPLKASKSVEAGDFYFKKGNLAAAKGRYKDATLYDPGSATAFEKLGEVAEKLRDFTSARDAYTKYLDLAPAAKDADAIKKRMEKFPAPKK